MRPHAASSCRVVRLASCEGNDRLVLESLLPAPRLCKSCGHGYEVIPPTAGCYVVIVFSALGVLLGAVLVVFGILAPFFILLSNDRLLWVIGRSIAAFLLGGTLIHGSVRGFSKYCGFLHKNWAEPDVSRSSARSGAGGR
jgi:hypothetical protein